MALISEKEFQSALFKVSANLVDLEKTPYQQNVLKNELIQQQMVQFQQRQQMHMDQSFKDMESMIGKRLKKPRKKRIFKRITLINPEFLV